MAAAARRLRYPGARALGWALRASHPSPSHAVHSQPPCLRSKVTSSAGSCQRLSSAPVHPPTTKPTDAAAAAEAAERGLRILRERTESLEQSDAVEALRLLLKAAGGGEVPPNVFFALGNLYYVWGDLLEVGKRAELGAEGAARAVVAEIKELRKQALMKRRLAPGASSGRGRRAGKGSAKARQQASESRADDEKEASLADTDHPEAWGWYLKAGELGDTRAMIQLGDLAMESAARSAANARLAEEWYRKAARGDPPQPDAFFQLARMHHEGIGVPCDQARARELYDEAHEAGSSAAAYFLGHRFHVGDEELGVEPDGVRALQLLQQASEQGHAEATFYLAQAYRSGSPEMGLPKDLRLFGELVQQAAAAGSADALFALGGAFFHGEDGFAPDPRAAFRCYSSAADEGHVDASYCLGVMQYAMGNMEEAFRRYQTAAEGGNVLAWRNLASMHALGQGVPRSEQMAKNILSTFGDEIRRQEKEQGEDEEQR